MDLDFSYGQNVTPPPSSHLLARPLGIVRHGAAGGSSSARRQSYLSPLAFRTATNLSWDWIFSDGMPDILLWMFKCDLKKIRLGRRLCVSLSFLWYNISLKRLTAPTKVQKHLEEACCRFKPLCLWKSTCIIVEIRLWHSWTKKYP